MALDADTRARLAASFPDTFPADGELDPDGPLVPAARHVELAALLKELGFTLYVTVVASHWPEAAPTKKTEGHPEFFEVATVLRRPTRGDSPAVCWRVRLEPGEPCPTLYPLFAGADWQEREQFDLVGVRFSDHPDLRRLMLPEDWQGHPLQKDYAIDTPHAPWR